MSARLLKLTQVLDDETRQQSEHAALSVQFLTPDAPPYCSVVADRGLSLQCSVVATSETIQSASRRCLAFHFQPCGISGWIWRMLE